MLSSHLDEEYGSRSYSETANGSRDLLSDGTTRSDRSSSGRSRGGRAGRRAGLAAGLGRSGRG